MLDRSGETALDAQHDAALEAISPTNPYRGDQSLIEIASDGTIDFQRDSMTLATSGQIVANAAARTLVGEGATLDVAGSIGVKIAMESNNLDINVQGNEQRDSPINRDSKNLNNSNIWVDRRSLVLVKGDYDAKTNPTGTPDRWYTAGGLLEVGGYLATAGHTAGEWMAQGGTVLFGGGQVVTQAGSAINLSGGTLDVQDGYINQSWLRGSDGRLYEVSRAPGDLLYMGLYKGYEDIHARWGEHATRIFYNPLIGPRRRFEQGYTVGRDAGRLIVSTGAAVLEGEIESEVFEGDRQTQAPQFGLDGYSQSQSAAARRAHLMVGHYIPSYDKASGVLSYDLDQTAAPIQDIVFDDGIESIAQALGLDGALPAGREDTLYLDSVMLDGFGLGGITTASDSVTVDAALQVAAGGEITLQARRVQVNADLIARSGAISLGDTALSPVLPDASVTIAAGATLDASGLWSNLPLDPASSGGVPYVNGGKVSIRSTGAVTLEVGSVIDVSSGASLFVDGKLKGGRGGDVTLAANAGDHNKVPAVLTVGGEIRGYGVAGGGTLEIESGTAVGIGGELLRTDGILKQGEAAPANLTLLQDLVILAGEILPKDYVYLKDVALPGEIIQDELQFGGRDPIVLAANWQLPEYVGPFSVIIFYNDPDGVFGIIEYGPGQTPPILAAGSTFTSGSVPAGSMFPPGYQVPQDVFPNGLPIVPREQIAPAGSMAPENVTWHAGTVLPAGAVLDHDIAVQKTLALDAGMFQRGFANYKVRGQQGLVVADGAAIEARMPILRTSDAAWSAPTGAFLPDVLETWTPELYQEDPLNARLTQRAGAGITLAAGSPDSAEPAVLQIGHGAVVTVDPGQTIELSSTGQLTVDGTLNAWGGAIALLQEPLTALSPRAGAADPRAHNRSIWIGEDAVLDVAGRAVTAVGARGQRYGLVQNGGSIVLGGGIDENKGTVTIDEDKGTAQALDAFIVVRPGALLDASGAQAVFDIPGMGAQTVASNGGALAFSSYNGLYLDGRLNAAAGGAGAAGGTLAVALETPMYLTDSAGDAVLMPRELILRQVQGASVLADGLRPGQADEGLAYGAAVLGVDRIQAGGFDNVALLANGIISFDGDVSLAVKQSLRFYTNSLALGEAADGAQAQVELAAPYIRLAGATTLLGVDGYTWPTVRGGHARTDGGSHFSASADLIDVRDSVNFGAVGSIATQLGPLGVERLAFDRVTLRSEGDIRFLRGGNAVVGGEITTELTSPGDMTLLAAQIYPATGANARVLVGHEFMMDPITGYAAYDPARKLTIGRTTTEAPAAPYSVFGSLILGAAAIEQGGIVRAPLGRVEVGTDATTSGRGEGSTAVVDFLPGGITSVSAAGLLLPYGGTIDGITYKYDGADIKLEGVGSIARGIMVTSESVHVQPNAVLDLSGGGELAGAGFVPGRGGSTDARYNPLVQIGADGGGFTLPGLATNPVYAIVPGAQAGYAPVAPEGGAVDPMAGQQITVGGGVPGLPPGTYTLMPSTYALLPGAFRVELNGLAGQGAPFASGALRNGSWAAPAQLGVAHTDIGDSLFRQAILTSGKVLRSYSQYNETSFTQFAIADAARLGVARAMLPADAKTLTLRYVATATDLPRLVFEGAGRFQAAEGGYDGTVVVIAGRNGLTGGNGRIEIIGRDAMPTVSYDGITLVADDLNALGAARLSIGGVASATYGQRGNEVQFGAIGGNSVTSEIILRAGAVLSAPEVFLMAGDSLGKIEIEQGAGINTIGQGKAAYDSSDGFVYAPGTSGVLAVSNGWMDMLAPEGTADAPGAGISIGACAQAPCAGDTELYSEGTIALATSNKVEFGDSLRYGTRNLSLGVGAFNVGSAQALADAEVRGVLPVGLTLNQAVLDRLLAGDTQYGAPALENLALLARDSINFYGTAALSTLDPAAGKSSLERLVLTTPAIYGAGVAGDVATISTGTLVWAGTANAAGAVINQGAGTGAGSLDIRAERIEFGYGPSSRPDTVKTFDRLALGFATVNLDAGERITANHKGSLSVYQSQGEYVEGGGYQYSGGNLNITTPLMTGEAGSVHRINAGGMLTVSAPVGAKPDATSDALGAELTLDADSIVVDTAIVLPSGKLTMAAEHDLQLNDGAHIDMSGRKIDFFDVSKYSWGGDVILESRSGNILQTGGSVIDLSAKNNQAGTLSVTALDEDAGTVDLQGRILGLATGYYDAGGTLVPYASGGVDIHAQTLGVGQLDSQFAALNQRLNEGDVFGARSFQLKQGNLTIGDGLKAREVNVSVDNGSLTVTGTIDASGEQVGSIRLAGKNGLTIAGTALLDAHGTVLRVDSYGKIIDAPNRAIVELNGGGDGRLTLANGTRIDVRAGTEAKRGTGPGEHDGVDRGTVELNVRRLGGVTGGDIDIDAGGSVAIQGARSITVNGVWRYTDTGPDKDTNATVKDGSDAASGKPYWEVDQDYLDKKHVQNTAFMTKALADGNLLNTKLAGLNNAAYADAFHLRPGVELVTDNDLVVSGDIDLSAYRYGSVNPHSQKTGVYGSGEAGALVMRAGGDMDIHGSINDGFYLPDGLITPDDDGWVLMPGRQPFGGDVVVPASGLVTLADGTTFPSGKTLNYALPIKAMILAAGSVVKTDVTLDAELTLPAGTVLAAPIYDGANVAYQAGTLLKDPVTLAPGMRLGAGTKFADAAAIKAMTWPAGVPLPMPSSFDTSEQNLVVVLDRALLLKAGALIPGSTNVKLDGGAVSIDLRGQNNGSGHQGSNWAIARMLPETSSSWSMRLAAGADTAAADSRALQSATIGRPAGNLVLADAHYGLYSEVVPGKTVWTAGNQWGCPRARRWGPLTWSFAFLATATCLRLRRSSIRSTRCSACCVPARAISIFWRRAISACCRPMGSIPPGRNRPRLPVAPRPTISHAGGICRV